MTCVATALLMCVLPGLFAEEPLKDGTGDAVVLRDGAILRGALVEPNARGAVSIFVRRAWARKHLPAWTDRWEALDTPRTLRALAQRRERVAAWRADRVGGNLRKANDPINRWIDLQLASGKEGGAPEHSPVMEVKLARGDVRTLTRALGKGSQLLRLGWLAHFPEPENMKVADLEDALQGRGFDLNGEAAVSIEGLTGPPVETDAQWLVRRAATEATHDPDLRFIRYQGMVMPDQGAGQPLDAGAGLAAISVLKDLLGENDSDPLAGRLKEVAGRGGAGAVVTRLDMATDFSGVTVEMSLWTRRGVDNWSVAGTRSVRVRVEDLDAGAGKDLAGDPQVATIFQAVEALGLGGGGMADLKQKSLRMGEATRKALGQARTLAEADLAHFAISLADVPRGDAAGKAAP